MSTTTKVTGRQAAVDYLRENGGGPLPVKQVTAEAATRAKLKGKTPSATVAAQIYTAAKKGVLFRLAGRGQVELLPEDEAPTEAAEPEPTLATDLQHEVKPDPKPERAKRGGRKAAA